MDEVQENCEGVTEVDKEHKDQYLGDWISADGRNNKNVEREL